MKIEEIEDRECLRVAAQFFEHSIPDDLCNRLIDLDDITKQLGSSLISKQLIALIIQDWRG